MKVASTGSRARAVVLQAGEKGFGIAISSDFFADAERADAASVRRVQPIGQGPAGEMRTRRGNAARDQARS